MKLLGNLLIIFGICVVSLSLLILFLIYFPLLSAEIRYFFRGNSAQQVTSGPKKVDSGVIYAKDDIFGIVVPKIGANSKIVPNVDPYNSKEYQWALTKGVAQAKGSVVPGHIGNIFLFAHSSENFYEALTYNSVFYLLDKLEKGDKIYLFYLKKKYVYEVTGKKLVDPKDVSYLNIRSSDQTVTLMTCWPPGTTFKRLLVQAKLID